MATSKFLGSPPLSLKNGGRAKAKVQKGTAMNDFTELIRSIRDAGRKHKDPIHNRRRRYEQWYPMDMFSYRHNRR